MGGLDRERTKEAFKMTRAQLRLVIGILTGHCALNRHLAKMGLEEDPMCPRCWTAEETAEHFLTSCPALFLERGQTLGDSTISKEEVKKLPLRDLWNFIKRSRRFHVK